jgi:hypothetical protein
MVQSLEATGQTLPDALPHNRSNCDVRVPSSSDATDQESDMRRYSSAYLECRNRCLFRRVSRRRRRPDDCVIGSISGDSVSSDQECGTHARPRSRTPGLLGIGESIRCQDTPRPVPLFGRSATALVEDNSFLLQESLRFLRTTDLALPPRRRSAILSRDAIDTIGQ